MTKLNREQIEAAHREAVERTRFGLDLPESVMSAIRVAAMDRIFDLIRAENGARVHIFDKHDEHRTPEVCVLFLDEPIGAPLSELLDEAIEDIGAPNYDEDQRSARALLAVLDDAATKLRAKIP